MNLKDYKEATKVLWFWYRNSGLGFLSDAPSDGTTYGRKDGAWAAITAGAVTLQDVYTAGYFAQSPDTSSTVDGGIADGGAGYGLWSFDDGTFDSYMYIDAYAITLRTINDGLSDTGTIFTSNGLVQFTQSRGVNDTIVNFVTPIADTTIQFPAKTAGTYTLATTDQLTLFDILQTGYAESPDGNSWIDMDIDNTPYINTNFAVGTASSNWTVNQGGMFFTASDTGTTGAMEVIDTSVYLRKTAGVNDIYFRLGTPTADNVDVFLNTPSGASASADYYIPLSVNNIVADTNGNIALNVLTTLNEGSGIGWILSTSNRANFGNIGLDAIDFTVYGDGTQGALGTASFSQGSFNTSSGYCSVTFGESNTIPVGADFSFVGGDVNTFAASAYSSAAFGRQNTINQDTSFVANLNNTSNGSTSAVFGRDNFSQSYGEFVVGLFGTDYTRAAANSFTFNAADRIFNVGIGTATVSRADAFTILKSGYVGIGYNNFEASPSAALLQVNGATQTAGFTVAGLPTGAAGMRAYVTDSTVVASGNFGATVVGGGANTVPVFHDGTNWIIA